MKGFYSGFGPNVGRLAGFNCVIFLTLEQTKKMLSKGETQEDPIDNKANALL